MRWLGLFVCGSIKSVIRARPKSSIRPLNAIRLTARAGWMPANPSQQRAIRKSRVRYRQAEAAAPSDPVTLLAIGYYCIWAKKQPQRAAVYFSRLLPRHRPDRRKHHGPERLHISGTDAHPRSQPARRGKFQMRAMQLSTFATSWRKPIPPRCAAWRWIHEKHFDDDAQTAEYVPVPARKRSTQPLVKTGKVHAASRQDGYPDKTAVYNGGFR